MGSYISYYTYMVSKSQRFTKYLAGYDRTVDPPEPIYRYDVVQEETMLDGNATQINIEGLEPNTAYYIKLKACNRAGCTYKILGPIITWKEGTTAEITNVQYKQNPLTGLMRVWWDCSIVPDHTNLHFSGMIGGRDADATVYNQLYIDDFELEPGTYQLTIMGYTGSSETEEGTALSPIELYNIVVKRYSIGLVCDDLIGIENVSYMSSMATVEFTETFTISDLVNIGYLTTHELAVESTFSIKDNIVITVESGEPIVPKEYIYLEAESTFAITDRVDTGKLGWVYIEGGSSFTILDSFDKTKSRLTYLAAGSSFRITDKVVSTSGGVWLNVGSSISVRDSFMDVHGPIYTITEHTSLYDSYSYRRGDWQEYGERVYIHDGPYQPPITTTLNIEKLAIYDTSLVAGPKREDLQLVDNFEGSELGQTYDFSHVSKGVG